jgi:Ciliary basal body-associated, B9 protein
MVWNFPLEMTWKSTNAFGWPQLAVSVLGLDALGREVLKGYGCTHLPTCAGRYVGYIRFLLGARLQLPVGQVKRAGRPVFLSR